MVPPLDETIMGLGEGRIAKNPGVVNRIDSVQAARDHTRSAFTVAIAIRPSRGRSGAENAEGGGDCKRDESHPSTHGFLRYPDATRILGAGSTHGKSFGITSQLSAIACELGSLAAGTAANSAAR
jgi:hypothetical protein